jgi:hypothetical protein
MQNSKVQLIERIKELEDALEGWERLGGGVDQELTPESIKEIARRARIFYLKNPLVNRGINVKADYVWGRGLNINAPNPELNKVIQSFLDDTNNKAELTTQQARIQREIELQTDGNLFFVLFVHPLTGSVRVSFIPLHEIDAIIPDPNSRNKNIAYRRVYTVQDWDFNTGTYKNVQHTEYYKDWHLTEDLMIGDKPVVSNAVVYHVKIGAFSDWQFGVSDIYAALDWAKAYTEFLSNFASIVAAHRRYAWELTAKGGARGVQAAKQRLSTTIGDPGTNRFDTNPSSVTAATFITTEPGTLTPVKTAGATTPATEGRPLKLMVAAAQGVPETFYGDADVGNHATAKTLDRPTELGFTNRQELWKQIYADILDYVVLCAVKAPNGPLTPYGRIEINEYNEPYVVFKEGFDRRISIDFPPLLERDTEAYIRALISAFTFDGKQLTEYFAADPRYVIKLLLTAIGENNVDEILDQLFSDWEDVETEQDLMLVSEAAKELAQAIKNAQHTT